MKQYRYIPIFLLTLASCTTIFNKKTYHVPVTSRDTGDKAVVYDQTYKLPAIVEVRREKAPLLIKLISDSSEVDFRIRSRWDPKIYLNLLDPLMIGAIVDLTNKKRFTYGSSITLDKSNPFDVNKRHYFKKTFPTHKGDLKFTIAIPEINSFRLQPNGEPIKTNTGFLGISTGIEYYYRGNKFINIRGDAVTDFASPFPLPVDYVGLYEQMYSSYLSVADNVAVNRFTFGYGVSFGSSGWYLTQGALRDSVLSQDEPRARRSWSAGLVFNTYHRFSKSFFVGVIYRPAFLRTSPKVQFKYEHLISIDLMWKISLRRRED